MQGLQEIWGLDRIDYSWATAGYLGAINSGCATCGLLIGSSVAIGLRCGQGKSCIPIDDQEERNSAVQAVNELYRDFTAEFGSTDCRTLTACDFSKADEAQRYLEDKVYEEKCFRFFNFVMKRFIAMQEKGRESTVS